MVTVRSENRIRAAQSCAVDPRQAAREFHDTVMGDDTGLVIFFCSSEYDLAVLGEEMAQLFTGVELVGCTTAGEIGPVGYRNHSLAGVGFPDGTVTAVVDRLERLQSFNIDRGRAFVAEMLNQLEEQTLVEAEKSFAFLMIDGLSLREEPVAHVLQAGLGSIPLIGGSAGDGLRFSQTAVFHQGRFHKDSAVLVLMATDLPFEIFKIQHFIPGSERLVITEADAAHRIVYEINGLPAAREYARVARVGLDNLSPDCFAASPIVVLIDGTNYVRSIQRVNPDDSLSFYCAIEEGLVFRVARGDDLEGNLARALEVLENRLGGLQLVPWLRLRPPQAGDHP